MRASDLDRSRGHLAVEPAPVELQPRAVEHERVGQRPGRRGPRGRRPTSRRSAHRSSGPSRRPRRGRRGSHGPRRPGPRRGRQGPRRRWAVGPAGSTGRSRAGRPRRSRARASARASPGAAGRSSRRSPCTYSAAPRRALPSGTGRTSVATASPYASGGSARSRACQPSPSTSWRHMSARSLDGDHRAGGVEQDPLGGRPEDQLADRAAVPDPDDDAAHVLVLLEGEDLLGRRPGPGPAGGP